MAQDKKLEEKMETHARMKKLGKRGKAYAEEIDELHDRICELCKKHGIGYFSTYVLDATDEDSNAVMITALPYGTPEDTEERNDSVKMLFTMLRAVAEQDALAVPRGALMEMLTGNMPQIPGMPKGAIGIPISPGDLPPELRAKLAEVVGGLIENIDDDHGVCNCTECQDRRLKQKMASELRGVEPGKVVKA